MSYFLKILFTCTSINSCMSYPIYLFMSNHILKNTPIHHTFRNTTHWLVCEVHGPTINKIISFFLNVRIYDRATIYYILIIIYLYPQNLAVLSLPVYLKIDSHQRP